MRVEPVSFFLCVIVSSPLSENVLDEVKLRFGKTPDHERKRIISEIIRDIIERNLLTTDLGEVQLKEKLKLVTERILDDLKTEFSEEKAIEILKVSLEKAEEQASKLRNIQEFRNMVVSHFKKLLTLVYPEDVSKLEGLYKELIANIPLMSTEQAKNVIYGIVWGFETIRELYMTPEELQKKTLKRLQSLDKEEFREEDLRKIVVSLDLFFEKLELEKEVRLQTLKEDDKIRTSLLEMEPERWDKTRELVSMFKEIGEKIDVREYGEPEIGDNLYLILGNCYIFFGEYEEALRYLKDILDTDFVQVYAWNSFGVCQSILNSYQEAKKGFRKALYINPKAVFARYNLGLAYNVMGDFDKATALLEEVVKVEVENPQAFFNLGIAYAGKERHKDAVSAFRKAVKHAPLMLSAWVNMAKSYIELKDYENSIECFETILAFQPDYAEAWYNLALQHLKLGEIEAKKVTKKPEERRNPHAILAIEYLGNALAYNPEYAKAWIELGQAHRKVGNKAQALEAFRKAVNIDPKLRETLKKQRIFI